MGRVKLECSYTKPFREFVPIISGPPSDFWSPSFLFHPFPDTSLLSPLHRRVDPRHFTKFKDNPRPLRVLQMLHRNDSYHQLQRFVLYLRLHVDDPPRNSLWKWKPSPASAARKCRDVIHFAQPHSYGRAVSKDGWGMGTPMLQGAVADWTDFVERRVLLLLSLLLIGLPCYQGFPGDSPKQKGKWMKILLLSWRGIH